MLKIRLTRKGKKNKAFFRLVVAEHTSPIKGRFLEALGFLNPHTKEKKFEEERIKYWLGKGAQCSDTAHNLLVKEGIVKGPKRAVKMRAKASDEADKADVAEKAEEKSEEKKETVEKKEEAEPEKTEETKAEAPEKEEKKEKPVKEKKVEKSETKEKKEKESPEKTEKADNAESNKE